MGGLISPEDLMRLIETVSLVSSRLGCSPHDAIDHLHRLAGGEGGARMPRTISKFTERHHSIRARRNELLNTTMFRDPAWDMLLDLYIAQGEGRPASTSALGVGSGAPATTALRHMDRLEQAALIVRTPDQRDHRRTLVELAPGVKEKLEAFLVRLQDCY